MGIAFILLGLLAAGTVVDLVVENELGTEQSYSLVGGSFTMSERDVIIAVAVLGALGVVMVFLGVGLLRGSWGRRRAMKRRISVLERENGELRSKVHLTSAVEGVSGGPASRGATG